VEVTQLGNSFYQQALTGQPSQQHATTGNMSQQNYQQQPSQTWGNSAPQQFQVAQPQPPTQEDWLNDPASAAQKQQDYFNATQFQPQLQQLYTNNAATARQLVATEHAEAFKRWGPEIDSLIMRTDPQMRTPDNLRMIVQMVKGQHADEYITEKAKAEAERILAQRGDAGAISTPGGVGTSAPGQNVLNYNVDELPGEYRRLLESEGLIREGRLTNTFQEFISKVKRPGQTIEDATKDWFEAAKRQDIIFSSSGRGLRVEEKPQR